MKPSPATVVTWPKFNEIEWSQRSQNAFAHAGVTTWRQLLSMSVPQLRALRGLGAKSVREMAGHLIKSGVRPKFLNSPWALHAHRETDGMVILAGPFEKNQRHMLEAAIGLLNGDVKWAVSNDPANEESFLLWRDKKGFIPVDELADGE